jgi:2,4-dienoyl-CoA reductase-like NADH-dependent reductase (Old Yellow Enzyme family)
MCQYSAEDGSATDWHLQHLMQLSMSGAGLVMVEATGVERIGRITPGCLGLYSDANEAALARVLAAARKVAPGGTRFGIQISHAGRKASTQRPWEGGRWLPAADGAWPTVAPSAVPFFPDGPVPEALDEPGMARVIGAFRQAAGRAVRLGFEVVELHMAHGYLLQEFLTPLANRRSDAYGGSREARMRFPLEVARAVRAAVPAAAVLGARINGTDWAEGGVTPWRPSSRLPVSPTSASRAAGRCHR